MMSLEKNKFPEFLKESDFLRNLEDEDDDLVTIPKEVLKENDEVNNIKDFKKLLKTFNFFGIDYPESLREYSRYNIEEVFNYFYPKSYKIEIKDMFSSLSDIFDEVLENKTKKMLDDIIEFFEDLEDPDCIESKLLTFYDFKKIDEIYPKATISRKKHCYGIKTCIEEKYVKMLYYVFNSILDNNYTFFENIPSVYKDISLNEKINILEAKCSDKNLEMHKDVNPKRKKKDKEGYIYFYRTYITLKEFDTTIFISHFYLIANKYYKKITNNVIEYYRKKERKSKNEYKYYTHTEFDSNVSVFEGLSNANLLGIKSKLEEEDVNVLLALFQAIVSDNYYILEKENLAESFDENKETEEEEFKMPKTTKELVKILKFSVSDDTVVKNKKPKILKEYLMKGYEKFKQKYITIDEMNINMQITEKKLIL